MAVDYSWLNMCNVTGKGHRKSSRFRTQKCWTDKALLVQYDAVEQDARRLGIRSWKTSANDRNGWQNLLEGARVHRGP